MFFVDVAHSCQQDNNVEGEARPNAKDDQGRHTHIDIIQPVDWWNADKTQQIVNDPVRAIEK